MQESDIESCLFPRLSILGSTQRPRGVYSCPLFECQDIGSEANILPYLTTAWSILLAKYADTPTAQFGVFPEGVTSQPQQIIEEWSASFEPTRCVREAVLLQKVRGWLFHDCEYRGRFNSCVIHGCSTSWIDQWAELSDHPIALILLVETTETPRVSLYCQSSLLDEGLLGLLRSALQHILRSLSENPKGSLQSLEFTSESHRRQIHDWNESVPKEAVDKCIHHLIQRQCFDQPAAEAICAWDGSLTYAELDDLSSSVMHVLHGYSIGPETIVPLLFEKSKWTAVSMFGVLKAGAAFVLLDPAHPDERLQVICQDVGANVILTSTLYKQTSSGLADTVIVVPYIADISGPEDTATVIRREKKTSSTSRNAAYVSYTSGSTGKPKGIVIEHASMCTNALSSSEAQNLTGSSRVLQFASYAFDVSIHETLVPLMLGGCVCVPSDSQRVNNLQEAIIELCVNWMELTPSVARLLTPEEIPAVKTMVVGGESMPPTEIARWAARMRLVIAYGPAECTVVSTVQAHVAVDGDPLNIGRGYGGTTWVVEAENHNKLVPIGAAGELLIGGPIVGREYLNRPQQTTDAFVASPPWMTSKGESSRVYKTGDLVRQLADGTLVYLGRKDTQVKLRGQRIELGEIEHFARDIFPGAAVAVEMGKLYHGRPALVLFVEWEPFKDGTIQGSDDGSLPFCKPNHLFEINIPKVKARLDGAFPRYMVPELLIPLRAMPLSQTTKVDRKSLRSMISKLTKNDLQAYRLTSNHSGRLGMEFIRLIAHVLALSPDEILEDDDFFHLGGDSISAIKLAKETQKIPGLMLTVTDIFQTPVISQLCQKAQKERIASPTASIPVGVLRFSLVDSANAESLKQLAADQCGVPPYQLEDIYPCSPLQERLMARTARQPGAFQARFTFRMPTNIDWNRLRCAWGVVADSFAILRTRIVNAGQLQSTHSILQAVVRGQDIEWLETEQTNRHGDSRWERLMSFGTPLIYLVACRDSSNPTLTLVMHHALFDWWSYNQILDAVKNAYLGQYVDLKYFSPFIKYIADLSKREAREFWKQEFSGLQEAPFLAHRSASTASQAFKWTQRDIHLRLSNQRGATTSSMIRLAWAMVVCQHTSSLDAVFGVTVMGRSIDGAADTTGPTIATHPVRIRLQENLEINEALKRMQDHRTALIPFEQTGIQEIQQASPEAAMACEFQSLLVVQPQSEKGTQMELSSPLLWELENDTSWKQQSYANFSTQILNVICEPEADKLTVNAFFDDTVLSEKQVQSMLECMERFLGTIVHNPTERIESILGEKCEPERAPDVFQERKSLAKLELTARTYLGDRFQVVAEWITPKGMRTSKLVLFVGVPDVDIATVDTLILTRLEAHIHAQLSQLMIHLRNGSLGSLVPACCIPIRLQSVPSESIVLLGRAFWQEAASKLTWSALRAWEKAGRVHAHKSLTSTEAKLQGALASVLRLEPDDIGIHDDFVTLGCDSLIAMQFAAMCIRDSMTVSVSDIFHAKSVARLALKVGSTIPAVALVPHSFSSVQSMYGDLRLFERDMKGFDEISNVTQVIDAFPCTSTHLGLLPQDSYLQAHTIWELTGLSDMIDPFRLAGAWGRLVDHHSILRTVLLQSKSSPSKIFQVVLSDAPVDVDIVRGVEDENIWPVVRKPFLSSCGRDELPLKFTVYQTTTGRVFCKLEGRHAFLDATSVSIILQELGPAYNGTVPPAPEALYQLWASYLHEWGGDSSHLKFWRRYLAGIRPCIFNPRQQVNGINGVNGSSRSGRELRVHTTALAQAGALRKYCDKVGFNMTNVIQVAWALLLRKLTGLDDVCFGTLVSGRDAPVPNVSSIIGPLFNLLVCRFSMVENKPLRRILEDNELAIRERLRHQHCSLKEVTMACSDGHSPLFNTCLSVEQPLSSKAGICFREVETHEETEVD
ncbi:amino acid adenylation domain-containing protein [Coccidioides immitis RS]|uniref:Amino acid adenylation domain-containing protein n=1 Tax=Coccidioides immitis (strain RS) TaxID=246410 RepID=A0A0E1RXW8_COCIM|nr:amino acid adenylation domain-containing protein [Coccidioides immitis RS]EAS31819.2 amino acid adenylation domain-containing protein [Coccidioides immitis RS]